MKIKGVIFDVDGTLLDSMAIWQDLGKRYLESKNKVPQTNINDIIQNMSLLESANYFKEVYDISDDTQQVIHDISKIIEHFYEHEVQCKKNAIQFLKLLHEKNIHMCVATSGDRKLVDLAFKRLGISEYFLNILTCTEIGHGKDSPIIYNEALQVLNTSKHDTLIFEDAYYAMKTASEHGFNVICVYDEHEKTDFEIIEKTCLEHIHDFLEMRDYFD